MKSVFGIIFFWVSVSAAIGQEYKIFPQRKYQMPLFKGLMLDGKIMRSKSLNGSIIVINTWALSCKPCREEIPELNKLVDKYAIKGVKFLGIGLEPLMFKETYIDVLSRPKLKFKYNILIDGAKIISKIESVVPEATQTLPSHYIIDRQGNIRFWAVGKSHISQLETTLVELIKETNAK